ncbi:ComG operon protein 7 [Schinkia azotoformans MEV2011]|uniref:ComG operon protein 7 n=2 Tax=Schinkia azotoformans TaxID=1454 RepID=K6BYM0_SCHAZ|nr:competence type IV pilus minor pilin ComGG [Schinkia azotoformans]EKN63990.1 hypothetical protein BAZO_15044 [Schinkia azotoformans LMG 9581]KEF38740.1 ComG operon protein 7 [Schinkia azotoformans MEV2011]MEC1640575.1 competence type IV pilus minor pilin ComGG [Schinkia azotoformans]MEC1697031.1 competence type IV pilus minor pilin ComGG [Schinkia azotoformans]MEC1718070.1 competence type IV pilus minor pilin ComGG [Schinkia azotoformans]
MYVIFNQRGFILPLTMMFCFLFSLFLLSEVEIYKIEQRLYIEEEELENLKSLLQIGIQDINDIVQSKTLDDKLVGRLEYPIGSIQYTIELLETKVILIQGTCITNKQRKQLFNAIVNIETQKIVRWVEG